MVTEFDPAVRASAFDLLTSIAFGKDGDGKAAVAGVQNKKIEPAETSDQGEFFAKFDHAKESDNIRLISAWLYSQFGITAISNTDIQREADSIGITVPRRADVTMKSMKHDKKNLFKQTTKGTFELTVHGEKFVKDTYKVRKGTRPKLNSATDG